MLITLIAILEWDMSSPEIMLEPDGDLCLDWEDGLSISINARGGVSWAHLAFKKHGKDIQELKKLLGK